MTVTTDNGTEFCNHKAIARALDTTVYFTDPYSSWQKGAIENANGGGTDNAAKPDEGARNDKQRFHKGGER